MKFISLFAGIGGFDLALTRHGHECVWANEWDKYAAQIYDKNFFNQGSGRFRQEENLSQRGGDTDPIGQSDFGQHTSHIDTRDIRTVSTEDIPDHDLLVGGFPCQAFSIAGKRRGFDDTRGTLFFEIARILREKKPRLFILENVKGLLSHDGGNTFKIIISTLDELGYDLQWQVLNSKNFGVPQNRERVFIIGNLRGTSRPQVFPIGEDGGENNGVSGYIANTLTSRYEPAQATGTCVGEGELNAQETESSGQDLQQTGDKPDDTDIGGGQTHTTNIRRLTPTECERLQGFPDGWTAGVSDTQRYKCLGNAVTVNVVERIVTNLDKE